MRSEGDGKYSLEAKLTKSTGEFQIVRDMDCFQVFYPATPQGKGHGEEYIVGPKGGGHGFNWLISGSEGETYTITFERKSDVKQVTWAKK